MFLVKTKSRRSNSFSRIQTQYSILKWSQQITVFYFLLTLLRLSSDEKMLGIMTRKSMLITKRLMKIWSNLKLQLPKWELHNKSFSLERDLFWFETSLSMDLNLTSITSTSSLNYILDLFYESLHFSHHLRKRTFNCKRLMIDQ